MHTELSGLTKDLAKCFGKNLPRSQPGALPQLCRLPGKRARATDPLAAIRPKPLACSLFSCVNVMDVHAIWCDACPCTPLVEALLSGAAPPTRERRVREVLRKLGNQDADASSRGKRKLKGKRSS